MASARAIWLAVVSGVLGLAPRARGLEDSMQNTTVVDSLRNFEPVADAQDAASFNGDTSRFVRSGPGPGVLNYTLNGSDISDVQIDFFAKESSLDGQTWLMEFRLQSDSAADPWVSVGQLRSTEDVGREVDSSQGSQASGTGSKGSSSSADAITWTMQTEPVGGWHRGSVKLNALSVVNQVEGCSTAFSLEVRGQQKGVQDDLQIGRINLQPTTAEDQNTCTQQIVDCPTPRNECAVNKIAPTRKLSYWFDGATSLDTLDSNSNIYVADDLPEGLDSGTTSFARSDDASPGTLRYRFDGQGADTGMVRMAVTILASPKGANFSDSTVSVTPRVNTACDSPSATVSTLSDFDASQSLGNWSIYDLSFELGTDRTLPPLGCELPKYALIEFNSPAQYGLRIAAVRMSGIGQPAQQLQSINGIADTPKQDGGILTNMLFVYIAVGIGALIVLFLLVLVWYCLGRPCCCGGSQQGQQAGNIKDKNGSLMHGQHMMRNGSNGQIMIAVDSGYPADMPHSYDDDGRFSPDKYGMHNGMLANGHKDMHSAKMSRDIGAYSARQPGSLNGHGHGHGSMHGHGHGHGHEPVVDLALPGAYSQMRTDSGTAYTVTAPRQGQDIFDTWQQTGLGYVSGDDPEMSGPLDTQAPSFTANPPISSTGNTSPTQESSVMGVTAQLGMRLNELRGMQSEHEKLARGDRHGTTSASDNEQPAPAAPEPLGVTYGKRIGVGGFGAVYEGTWSGKQVAVKVIKMPQTNKPGEEKAKMGFMEYAISGILLHDNIVQTYQADIRPVFLEDDGSEGQKSKSGWTGLGDFLSNDAVSQQLQRSMRIQEWELRLIMEYCNRGNLKEAIRNSTLQREGAACALDVALLGLDVAKGCQAIHRYNIIHGDLKPHNVLLTAAADDERGWNGKIADFGLSVKIKRGEQHVSGIQHGTEGYVAPEVLQTRRMVKASDVYSFGILMWELWHSRLYYEEHRNAVKRMRRPNLEFRPTFERHCPEEWVNLAKLCWSLKPEERPDFDRVVKMMQMIVDSIREKIDERGIIPRPDPAELNLL